MRDIFFTRCIFGVDYEVDNVLVPLGLTNTMTDIQQIVGNMRCLHFGLSHGEDVDGLVYLEYSYKCGHTEESPCVFIISMLTQHVVTCTLSFLFLGHI